MRRLLAVAATGALLIGSAAGCATRTAGTDGDPIDDWGALPVATSFTPRVGTCHPALEPVSHLGSYSPVDCAESHRTETVHVGTFTGALARQASPPKADSPALRTAFAQCDAAGKRFVGGDWRDGPLSVTVVTPSPQGWAGGSRWYRCDLFELIPVFRPGGPEIHEQATQRAGSLRNALVRPSALAFGCFTDDLVLGIRPVDCGTPHRIEYAGVWTAPLLPDNARDSFIAVVHRHCRSVIAAYIGMPANVGSRVPIGTKVYPPSHEGRQRGDRGFRCFLWSDNRDLTRSLRGAGPRALPV